MAQPHAKRRNWAPNASRKRIELLTELERRELTLMKSCRLPRSWVQLMQIHGISFTDLILEAVHTKLGLLKRRQRAA